MSTAQQGSLFETKEKHDPSIYERFARLGEMMGDGLHHEGDGKWIVREYNQLSKILLPGMHEKATKRKNERVDKAMAKLLSEKTCTCGGGLKQARKGSYVCYCTSCNKRFKAK